MNCNPEKIVRGLIHGVSICFAIYFAGCLYYFRKAFAQLRKRQYINFRLPNILVRLEVSPDNANSRSLCQEVDADVHDRPLFPPLFLLSSLVCSWKHMREICIELDGIYAFAVCHDRHPLHQGMSDLPSQTTRRHLITSPLHHSFLGQIYRQMALRDFAWSEEDLPGLMAKCTMDKKVGEPMFCFERAIKCLYWCYFIYDFKQVTPLFAAEGSGI